MNKSNFTLALYGIQDLSDDPFPAYVHDHNLALFEEGELLKYLALERHTRNKYDSRLPGWLYKLLKQEKILGIKNMDLVFVDNTIGRAFISKEGNIRFEAPLNHQLSAEPEKGKGYFLDRPAEAYAVNHELAHIFSNMPFYGPFKENSLHVHFDGGASKSNFSAWIYRNGRIRLLEYHWDLDHIASFFNANALTFSLVGARREDQNSMPGKFMGYAAYGNHDDRIELWLKKNNYFSDIWGKRKIFFDRVRKDWNRDLKSFDLKDPFLQNVAATFQHIFQRELLKKMEELQKATGTEYLYYSGGSALNIKANAVLVNSGLFRKVFIPPCTNDSGLSIGAGAFVEWLKHGYVKRQSPFLNNWFINNPNVRYSESDLTRIAKILYEGKAVGVMNGNGEAGPRALGNRSILARPDSRELSNYISRRLKQREWYRPLAPVMLEKNLSYFTDSSDASGLSRYMLTEFRIRNEKISEMEGAIHVDGTSRIQTLSKREENPFLYDLLTIAEEQYGIRAFLNTSFNSKGAPLVHTEGDALSEARQMGLNHLVLNGSLKKM
ncbi:MAG: carbamoyltransferase C-terminal domain-containing protein [Bacteroidales bacterium]